MTPTSRSKAHLWRRGRTLLVVALLGTVLIGTPTLTSPAAAAAPAQCDDASSTFQQVLRTDDKGPNSPQSLEANLRSEGVLNLCTLDSFYTPPASLVGTTSGQVLKARPVYPSPGGPSTVAARIMYVSRLRDGSPVAATGLVMIPKTAPPAEGRKITAVAHGTIGIADSCVDAIDAGLLISPDLRAKAVTPILQQNGVLIMPDYFGIGARVPGREYHSYMVMEEQSNATLDMARAVLNLPTSFKAINDIAVTGHSQGGQTTLEVNERAATYAPELNVRALVAVSAPGDLAETLADLGAKPNGIQFFLAMALFGLDQAYDGINPTDYLSTTNKLGRNAYQTMRDLLANNGVLNDWYRLKFKSVVPTTPDSIFMINTLGTQFGQLWNTDRLRFVSPRMGRGLLGCDTGAITKVTDYVRNELSPSPGTILKPGSDQSPTHAALDVILPANSAPRAGGPVPTANFVGDCDAIVPITRPLLASCPHGVTPEFVGSTSDSYTLGRGLTTSLRLCASPTPTYARVFGEVDTDFDGFTDDPAQEVDGNGLANVHFAHDVFGHPVDSSGLTAEQETKNFIDDARAGTASTNC